MLSINEQEILVDDLKEVEIKLFNIVEKLGAEDELGKAWHIVYKRLKKEEDKESKMKLEN